MALVTALRRESAIHDCFDTEPAWLTLCTSIAHHLHHVAARASQWRYRGLHSPAEHCMQGILAGYMIANAQTEGAGQGLITVGLQVLNFIAKKCLLQFADPVNLEVAMLVSGTQQMFICELCCTWSA